MEEGKRTSPYVRYAKVPYRYSGLYQQWSKAQLEGRDSEANRLARAHSRAYGLRRMKANGFPVDDA